MSNDTQPEIRFPGFTEDWEQRKLEELGNLNRGKSKHRPRNDSRLFGGEYPFIQTGDVAKAPLFLTEYSQTYSEFGIQQSKLWDIGTLLITIAANVADTTILGIKAAFPDSVIGFESTSCDVVFIKNYIDIQSDLLKRKAETSSQANLNLAKLKEMNLNVPKLKEQQKIGSFFKQLDDTIALHQRKIDLLKETKKGFLQKMFPKNGAKVPEIRFPGFTEDWEERKLGDITKISTGKLDANAMVENGKYDFYTSGIKKYRIDVPAFEGPAITIAGNGATVGYMHLADNKFNAYQRTYVLQEFVVDRSFLFSEVGNKLPKKINQEARTGNIPYIVMDMLTQLKLSIPHDEAEQSKIGSFFKQLDNTITLHQRKLDLLKETKRGFLQKMFV